VLVVGYQIYALFGGKLDLGLIGLVQFVPVLLMLPVGQQANRSLRQAARRPSTSRYNGCASSPICARRIGWRMWGRCTHRLQPSRTSGAAPSGKGGSAVFSTIASNE